MKTSVAVLFLWTYFGESTAGHVYTYFSKPINSRHMIVRQPLNSKQVFLRLLRGRQLHSNTLAGSPLFNRHLTGRQFLSIPSTTRQLINNLYRRQFINRFSIGIPLFRSSFSRTHSFYGLSGRNQVFNSPSSRSQVFNSPHGGSQVFNSPSSGSQVFNSPSSGSQVFNSPSSGSQVFNSPFSGSQVYKSPIIGDGHLNSEHSLDQTVSNSHRVDTPLVELGISPRSHGPSLNRHQILVETFSGRHLIDRTPASGHLINSHIIDIQTPDIINNKLIERSPLVDISQTIDKIGSISLPICTTGEKVPCDKSPCETERLTGCHGYPNATCVDEFCDGCCCLARYFYSDMELACENKSV